MSKDELKKFIDDLRTDLAVWQSESSGGIGLALRPGANWTQLLYQPKTDRYGHRRQRTTRKSSFGRG